MSDINYILLDGSVIVNYDGKTIPISKDDFRYEEIDAAIKSGNLEDIPALIEVERFYNELGLEIKDGLITVNGDSIPESLSKRIMDLREGQYPVDPLLKFWENLKQNPSFNSRQMLYDFLEHNGHPLTADGCFIAYRGVTDEFKDSHSNKFDNSIGKVCEMDRADVDDNPNNTCSSGLHVACYDFAKSWSHKTVEVKVNPKDVVCVPKDYNGTKMRVCKFEVLAECKNMHTEPLYAPDFEEDSDLKEDY